jgi:flagellar biosynthetic protein FlhB
MADPGSDEDKQHEPTQKKLDDARKKGDLPRSTELTTAAAYAGMLLAATALGGASINALGMVLKALVANPDLIAMDVFSGGGAVFHRTLFGAVTGNVAVWFLIPAVAAVLSIVAQRSLVFAPDKLQPKLSRISPLSNAKNKFGRSGLFEFAKSFTKLLIFCIVLGVFLLSNLTPMIEAMLHTERAVISLLFDLCIRFLSIVLVVTLMIGAVDFLWQNVEHRHKNRMSHKELRDEIKQSEGDPHLKQQRRQRGYDIAMNKMLADVPEADVIIVNPQHYAVALKWSRLPGAAPICVAKGVDEVAARIRAVAAEAGVPIHRDPPTARALHATVDIGQEIHPDYYQPVAAAIRFAEEMRRKARLLGRSLRGPAQR